MPLKIKNTQKEPEHLQGLNGKTFEKAGLYGVLIVCTNT